MILDTGTPQEPRDAPRASGVGCFDGREAGPPQEPPPYPTPLAGGGEAPAHFPWPAKALLPEEEASPRPGPGAGGPAAAGGDEGKAASGKRRAVRHMLSCTYNAKRVRTKCQDLIAAYFASVAARRAVDESR